LNGQGFASHERRGPARAATSGEPCGESAGWRARLFNPRDQDLTGHGASAIAAQLTHLRKLSTFKSGLMQDLLTGRVRVNVDDTTKDPIDA